MKHAGQAQKHRMPTLEEEADEKEFRDLAQAVADGFATPAPGLHHHRGAFVAEQLRHQLTHG